MNATDINATKLVSRHDGPIYFNPTWLFKNKGPGYQTTNLVVVPLLGLLVFLVVLCVQCCTWFRESLRDRNDGEHVFMMYAEILTANDEDYKDMETLSDTNSVAYYDTVSSFRSFMQGGDLPEVETALKSFGPPPDVACDDSVFSYRKFLIRELENQRTKSIARDEKTTSDPALSHSSSDIYTGKSKPPAGVMSRKKSISSETPGSFRVKRSGSKRVQRFHLLFVDKKTVSPKELRRGVSLSKTTNRPEINKKSPVSETSYNSSPRGLKRGLSLPKSSLRPELTKISPTLESRRNRPHGELKRVQSLPRSHYHSMMNKRSPGQDFRRKSLQSPDALSSAPVTNVSTKLPPDLIVPPDTTCERDEVNFSRLTGSGRDIRQTAGCSVCGAVDRNSLHSPHNSRELHPMFKSKISSFDSGLPSPTGSSRSSIVDEPVVDN